MELNYSIKLKQKEDEKLKDTLKYTGDYLSLKTFKFENEVIIKSNSKNISSYFKLSNKLVKSIKSRDNLITGYEHLIESLEKDKEIFKDILLEDGFLNSRYSEKLIPLNNFVYDKYLNSESQVYLLKYNEPLNSMSIIETLEYNIDYNTQTVIIDPSITDDSKYYLYEIKNNIFEYEPTSTNFNLKSSDFLNIPNGFYEILPSFKNNYSTYQFNSNNYNYKLFSKKSLKLISSLSINYDNCITDKFYYIPDFYLNINYGSNDYTPLNNVEVFDIDREYIIFELENNLQVPKYFLSSNNNDLDDRSTYDLLMQSHSEFKKVFSVIANFSDLKITNSDNTILETEIIKNKDFNRIKNDASFIDSIIKIRI